VIPSNILARLEGVLGLDLSDLQQLKKIADQPKNYLTQKLSQKLGISQLSY
jgi:hypothetical protein